MKIYIILTTVLFLFNCQTDKKEAMKESKTYPFYVGTYTNAENQGIYKYAVENDGSLKRIGLAAVSNNPSFLTMSADKKYLLAVNEINSEGVGAVESFLISEDSLLFINRSSSGGADPCFVTTNKSGYVLVANYSGGNVGLLKLNAKGELSPLLDVQNHIGSSIHPNQQGPHAHSAWFVTDNDNIISVDLGTNELWFSHLDNVQQKLIPADPQKLEMAPGAGPRHLVFHPNGKWIYVVNELDYTVTLVQKTDSDEYIKGESVSTLPSDYSGENSCADIHISSDGNFVYASNRGHDSIVIYSVNKNDGSLTIVGHQSTMGEKPRNFALSPDDNYLLVANQQTNNLVSFKRDKTSGLLKFVAQIEAPTPVCILF